MKSNRPLNADERRLLNKVRARRAKGMTWAEIASEFNMPWGTLYNKFRSLELRDLKLSCGQAFTESASQHSQPAA